MAEITRAGNILLLTRQNASEYPDREIHCHKLEPWLVVDAQVEAHSDVRVVDIFGKQVPATKVVVLVQVQ
jgi:hypothetical protein